MAEKRRIKKAKERDSRKITVQIPEEVYFQVKQWAKEEYRTTSQQARMFLEIGLQYLIQANEADNCGHEQEPEEKEPCIGFRVEPDYDEEDYDDE